MLMIIPIIIILMESWLLAYENRRGDAHEVAKGAALVERARASALREALEHIVALASPRPESGTEQATLAAIRRAAHAALAQGTTRRRRAS
jgi:predicted DNA-binding transcriptional regulator YafY